MNEREIEQAMTALIRTRKLYPAGNTDLADPDVYEYWADKVMASRDFSRVLEIIDKLPQTETFFPAIKVFCDMCDGVASKDDEVGMEIVSKIEKAVADIGASWEPANPPIDMWAKLNRVRDIVGPMGWDFIQTRGGWWSFVNGLDQSGLTDYQRNSWAKAITASYKQHRAFGPNPPPIGLPGAARPALNESSDIIDVKQIRAAPSSGVAAQYLTAAAAETPAQRSTSEKISIISRFRMELEQRELAKRKAKEDSRGKNQSIASPVGLEVNSQAAQG